MKLTLNLPNEGQSDLVKLAAEMNLTLEQTALVVLAAGARVVMESPAETKQKLAALFSK